MKLKDIVVIHDNELRAGTWLIAQGFGRRHNEVIKIVKKYQSDFEELSALKADNYRPNSGADSLVRVLSFKKTKVKMCSY